MLTSIPWTNLYNIHLRRLFYLEYLLLFSFFSFVCLLCWILMLVNIPRKPYYTLFIHIVCLISSLIEMHFFAWLFFTFYDFRLLISHAELAGNKQFFGTSCVTVINLKKETLFYQCFFPILTVWQHRFSFEIHRNTNWICIYSIFGTLYHAFSYKKKLFNATKMIFCLTPFWPPPLFLFFLRLLTSLQEMVLEKKSDDQVLCKTNQLKNALLMMVYNVYKAFRRIQGKMAKIVVSTQHVFYIFWQTTQCVIRFSYENKISRCYLCMIPWFSWKDFQKTPF